MTFELEISKRKRRGICCCWDCLREDGITPPRKFLDKHRRYKDTPRLPPNPYIFKKGERVLLKEEIVKDKDTGSQRTERIYAEA